MVAATAGERFCSYQTYGDLRRQVRAQPADGAAAAELQRWETQCRRASSVVEDLERASREVAGCAKYSTAFAPINALSARLQLEVERGELSRWSADAQLAQKREEIRRRCGFGGRKDEL